MRALSYVGVFREGVTDGSATPKCLPIFAAMRTRRSAR